MWMNVPIKLAFQTYPGVFAFVCESECVWVWVCEGDREKDCLCVLGALWLLWVRLQELWSVSWILISRKLPGGSDWNPTSSLTRVTIISTRVTLSILSFAFGVLFSFVVFFGSPKGMLHHFMLSPICFFFTMATNKQSVKGFYPRGKGFYITKSCRQAAEL